MISVAPLGLMSAVSNGCSLRVAELLPSSAVTRRAVSWSRPSLSTRSFRGSGHRSPTGVTDWSNTWSRTSTRSSTSDREARSRGPAAVVAGFVRLSHPFPSLLDGVVVAAVALIAGGLGSTAVALGVSMTALQASIGALNDIVDAPADRATKPGKPIPRGVVSRAAATAMAVVAAAAGIVVGWLAGAFGGAVVLLAGVVLVIGYAYDLFFKGTTWSW